MSKVLRFGVAYALILFAVCSHAATLGRVVPIIGGAADVALDEARGLLYLTSGTQSQVLVYSLARQSFQTPVPTDQTPLALARSRDGKLLYVACYDSSVLDVIDLASLTVTARVNLPARPEALAVAQDGRVLISTSGSGTALTNGLLLFNPLSGGTLTALAVTQAPPVAGPIISPAPANRPFLSARSQLAASSDGSFIAGVNVPTVGSPTVYLYESASGSILRSRTLPGLSTSLAISADATRVFCGVILLDAASFQVLAQHSPVNAVYPINPLTNFAALTGGAATLQGGSAFAPDGGTLYSALNVAPVGGAATFSQMTLNDPDNLLIRMGLQLPETLAGKMAISADGSNIYGLSDSGFVAVPVGTVSQSALAVPAAGAVVLTRDQCGVALASANLTINNPGRGRITASAQLLQYAGLANQPNPANAPTTRATSGTTTQVTFSINASLTRGLGTLSPPHDFAILSPEAVNIPDRVRVYENVRDSDGRGAILPLATGNSPAQPFPDLVYDSARQRIYVANFGLNRVEVFDIKLQQFLTPVKVGQSPVSLALTTDNLTLYVANSGGESISMVDPDKLQAIGQISFPPLPINSNQVILTPSVIVTSSGNPIVLMSNGVNLGLWTIVGSAAVPRGVSKVIGQTAQGAPLPLPLSSTMASTPGGDYVLLATPTGIAYLYDPTVDDFVASRQIGLAAGFTGPVAAGPRGQYFIMNGTVLNQALVVTRTAPGLISAVAAGTNSYVIFSPPAAGAANTLPATAPTVQVLNPANGAVTVQVSVLEGPVTQVAAAGRAVIGGRTMAIDTAGAFAYALTTSGLSIIPLTAVAAADRPQPFARGAVNLGSYQTAVAPNSLLSIFGTNLGASEVASSSTLPVVLGGTCVTLNNTAIPLFMTSPGQINAQIPPNLAPGSYPLVVRSLAKQAASGTQQITVSKYAPAVLVDSNGQLALFHRDGSYVNHENPGNRDEPLTLYAVGLGATKGGAVTAGVVSPSSPLAVTDTVEVFFGNPLWVQAAIIVDWSGLVPGFVGLYQLNLRIPGFHVKGDGLPVMLRMGTMESPTTGPVVPHVDVE